VGCADDHARHFCWKCHDEDSDHRASKCPYSVIVYHQTSRESAESIKNDGIDISKSRPGWAGKGFYAAKCIEDTDGKAQGGRGWIVKLAFHLGRPLEKCRSLSDTGKATEIGVQLSDYYTHQHDRVCGI